MKTKTTRRALGALCGLCALVAVGEAWAGSPWVLPAGELVLQLDYRTEEAEREFLPDGNNQDFSLNGRFSGQALNMSLRQGLGAGFEMSLQGSYKSIAYKADDVTVVATPGGVQLLPTFSLSNNVSGWGDLYLSARYNAYNGPVLLTPEIEVKVPTGYEPPSGTFSGDNPGLKADGDGNLLEYTRGDVPVEDDLALGDGQIDITASLLAGAFFPTTKTFARGSGGFRLRLEGPGHQVVYDGKLGQYVSQYFIVFAGVSGAYTVNEGRVIGKTFSTRAPETEASDFAINRFEILDLRLDKDFVEVSGGILFKPAGAYELNLTASKIVDGKNVAEVTALSLGSSYKF